MGDRAVEVVLARGYPVVLVVIERSRVAEPDILVDDSRVREQTQSFRLHLRNPILVGPTDRVGGRHIAEGGRIVHGFCIRQQGISYLRIGVLIEKVKALAEIPWIQRGPVHFSVANVKIKRNVVGELTSVISGDSRNRRRKAGRKRASGLIIGNDNVHHVLLAKPYSPGDSRMNLPSRNADVARDCRRGDRIGTLFAAAHESAIGTKLTNRELCYLSAFGGKADIGLRDGMPLLTQSRPTRPVAQPELASYCHDGRMGGRS